MTKSKDIEILSNQLIQAERAYWLDNDPIMPDTVYDDLRRKYRELTDGKERPIGLEGSGRKTLPSPMYSLDNVFNREEFEKWVRSAREKLNAEEIEWIVEYKHDGLSLSLHFANGKLLDAYNRGDGKEGEVITDKLPAKLRDITLPTDLEIEIRGEIFVPKSVFDEINLIKHASPYKTPRQCAVGILRGSDTTFKDKLVFRVFGAGKNSDLFLTESSYLENKLLQNFIPTEIFYQGVNASDAFKECEKICNSAKDIDYPIDGAVVKINSTQARRQLGYTAHHPRWAIAVKLKHEDYPTKLVGVEWSVGLQGTVTPTLIVDPVDIDGVTINRVTGDNASVFLFAKYAIGDTVYIKRAGDVIPKVTRHVPKKGDRTILTLPNICPACGNKTRMEGAYLKCSHGFLCDGQIEARLLHFVSRDALDLKGFGLAAIKWLTKECGIKSGAELLEYFRNRDNKETICKHFGELNGVKLMGVCRKDTYPLKRVLYALGIPNVGLVSAGKLASRITSLEALVKAFGLEERPNVPELSDHILDSIRYWLDHPNLTDEVLCLNKLLKTTAEIPITTFDKSVCFTGTGDGYTRGMLEQSAVRAGYKSTKSVTKKTSYLVTGVRKATKSKIDKALALNVPIITVADWIKKTT